jgi:hypothetical protein
MTCWHISSLNTIIMISVREIIYATYETKTKIRHYYLPMYIMTSLLGEENQCK